MSQVTRVTLICDGCYDIVTPPLDHPRPGSSYAVMDTTGYTRRAFKEHTFHLCPVCSRIAAAHSKREVEEILTEGLGFRPRHGRTREATDVLWDRREEEQRARDLEDVRREPLEET